MPKDFLKPLKNNDFYHGFLVLNESINDSLKWGEKIRKHRIIRIKAVFCRTPKQQNVYKF